MSAFGNPYFNPYQAMQYPNIQQQAQAQQSNLIHVANENQARESYVAPGGSMMFIDDNAPYIYTKTAGTSQLEPAVFKRFKIIEDSAAQNSSEQASNASQINLSEYMTKAEFEPFKAVIDDMKKIVKELNENGKSVE